MVYGGSNLIFNDVAHFHFGGFVAIEIDTFVGKKITMIVRKRMLPQLVFLDPKSIHVYLPSLHTSRI